MHRCLPAGPAGARTRPDSTEASVMAGVQRAGARSRSPRRVRLPFARRRRPAGALNLYCHRAGVLSDDQHAGALVMAERRRAGHPGPPSQRPTGDIGGRAGGECRLPVRRPPSCGHGGRTARHRGRPSAGSVASERVRERTAPDGGGPRRRRPPAAIRRIQRRAGRRAVTRRPSGGRPSRSTGPALTCGQSHIPSRRTDRPGPRVGELEVCHA